MTGKFLQHFTSLFSRGFSDKNKATSKALLRLRNAAFPLVSRTFFLPATSVNGNCACSIWTAHTNLCSQVQTVTIVTLNLEMQKRDHLFNKFLIFVTFFDFSGLFAAKKWDFVHCQESKANSAPPLSVTDSAIAPSARMFFQQLLT